MVEQLLISTAVNATKRYFISSFHKWWRRWELNPRPKNRPSIIYVCIRFDIPANRAVMACAITVVHHLILRFSNRQHTHYGKSAPVPLSSSFDRLPRPRGLSSDRFACCEVYMNYVIVVLYCLPVFKVASGATTRIPTSVYPVETVTPPLLPFLLRALTLHPFCFCSQ